MPRRRTALTVVLALLFGLVAVVAAPAAAGAVPCSGTSPHIYLPAQTSSNDSCQVATTRLQNLTGPVFLHAAVVVDDSADAVDYSTFRSYLIGTIFCRPTGSATVIFSTGAIRNIWAGVTAGVYPQGLLKPGSSTDVTCELRAVQVTLPGYSDNLYTTSSAYITPTRGRSGQSSLGPNKDGDWGTLANHSWPAGTEKSQVARTEYTSPTRSGTFSVLSSTNLTSCAFSSDTKVASNPCNVNDIAGSGPAYATITLWVWQNRSAGDYTPCPAAVKPFATTVTISAETHHLTVPQTGSLTLSTSCDTTIVVKTEIKVSGRTVYSSNQNTSVAGYLPA